MDERADRPAPAEGEPTRVRLVAELDVIEALTRFDQNAAYDRAAVVIESARAMDDTALRMRAELVQADVMDRRGHLTTAGRTARAVGRWAEQTGDRYLQARSNLVLAGFSISIGDASRALEHAVLAVQLLDESAPPWAHVDHQQRLAMTMAMSGDHAGARPRFAEAVRGAERIGDIPLLETILNNMAFNEYSAGEPARAAVILERVHSLARSRGARLYPEVVDTGARVLLALGRHAEAEKMLLELDPVSGMADIDVDSRPVSLLLLAELQRLRGALDEAQHSVDLCAQISDEVGLADVRARAHGEQAKIHAARGHFAEAYAEYQLFHEQTSALQSAENASRARTVQAVFETTEARQEAGRYREMSLRDPLTGLHNRRFVEEELPRLLRLGAGRAPASVTVALIDLDHFKRVNDSYSHEAGDQVLRAVAEILIQRLAEHGSDGIAARMGGEEFLLVLPPMTPSAATAALQEVRQAIAAHPWHPLTGSMQITVSIGATWTRPGEAEVAPSVLFARADRHLYEAKGAGRNRVVTDADPTSR